MMIRNPNLSCGDASIPSNDEFDFLNEVRRLQGPANWVTGAVFGKQITQPVGRRSGELSQSQSLSTRIQDLRRLGPKNYAGAYWDQHTRHLHLNDRRSRFSDWLSKLSDIEVSEVFENGYDIHNLELHSGGRFESFRGAVEKIWDALTEYESDSSLDGLRKQVSKESLRSFLVLVPVLQGYAAGVHLDPSSGCVIVEFASRGGTLLSLQVSGRGHIHYSRIGKNNKIFKITGTAKFACDADFVEFERVLGMI